MANATLAVLPAKIAIMREAFATSAKLAISSTKAQKLAILAEKAALSAMMLQLAQNVTN